MEQQGAGRRGGGPAQQNHVVRGPQHRGAPGAEPERGESGFDRLGMAALGPENPYGWRIATALAGIIAVVLLMLVARRLFRSTLLATLA